MSNTQYNLSIPEDLFNELQRIANKYQKTVLEVLQQFIKLGLFVDASQDNPDVTFIFRKDGIDQEIELF